MRIVNGMGAVLFLFVGLDTYGTWGAVVGAATWIVIYLPIAFAIERRRRAISGSSLRRT